MFIQCKLAKQTKGRLDMLVALAPDHIAQVGKVMKIKLKETDAEWDDGWSVIELVGNARPQIPSNRKILCELSEQIGYELGDTHNLEFVS